MTRGISDCCHYDDGYDDGFEDGQNDKGHAPFGAFWDAMDEYARGQIIAGNFERADFVRDLIYDIRGEQCFAAAVERIAKRESPKIAA